MSTESSALHSADSYKVASERIVVAMSGGVDSSVAALVLRRLGYDLVGISMQVWDYRKNGGCASKATCCAPSDFMDARKVAAMLDVPYYVYDFEHVFGKEVIDRFISQYSRGHTPNPCVDCNNKIKFKELRNRALNLGAPFVATGHYAQIKKSSDGFHLMRSKDSKKDQTYFLYGLKQEELSRTIFPIGHYTKDEVREMAAVFGLATASKEESQDICFVSGKLKHFLDRQGIKTKTSGSIVNRKGQVLGNHTGLHSYTIGQRKGLNVGGSKDPLYVLEIDPSNNTVVIGDKSELKRESFRVEEVSWCSPSILSKLKRMALVSTECLVQVRFRQEPIKVKVNMTSSYAEVTFKEDWTSIAPGQAAVFYTLDNQEVLGGGTIA